MIKSFSGFREVFSKPFYILVALAGALLFYILNVIISDFSGLKSISGNYGVFDSLRLTFLYFIGFPSTVAVYSAVFVFIIASLFGSYIALATYKTTQLKRTGVQISVLGSVGVFFGLITTGCAACGVGLVSLLGLGGALLALPFDGFEISIVSVVLLLYVNLKVADKIEQKTCPVKK